MTKQEVRKEIPKSKTGLSTAQSPLRELDGDLQKADVWSMRTADGPLGQPVELRLTFSQDKLSAIEMRSIPLR
jgi:hypothetical protein